MARPPGKRERNRQARREALYRAAVDLFRRQGYDETSVEQITRRAGLAKGTFFNYFPTKEHILLYIAERHMSRLETAFVGSSAQELAHHDSAIAALKTMLHTLADSLVEDRDLVRLAVDKAMPISYLATAAGDGRFSFRGLAAILVSRGQRSGEIHPDLDPEPVALILEGMYYQQLALWCQQDFSFDLGERLEQMVDLLVMGIGSRERRRA